MAPIDFLEVEAQERCCDSEHVIPVHDDGSASSNKEENYQGVTHVLGMQPVSSTNTSEEEISLGLI